jgi:hypothetical protein
MKMDHQHETSIDKQLKEQWRKKFKEEIDDHREQVEKEVWIYHYML